MSNNYLSSEQFALLIRQLERQFRRTIEEKIEPHGVIFSHWIFLTILCEEDGLSQRDLANRSGLTTPTVHNAISKMESFGMIERIIPEKSKSRPLIHLTEHGLRLTDLLKSATVLANDVPTKGISTADLDIVRSTLLKMISNLSKPA